MGNRLYCGNLAYETTEATLSELFGAIGEVVSVNLIADRYTGRSRGFAFIEMADSDAAQQYKQAERRGSIQEGIR